MVKLHVNACQVRKQVTVVEVNLRWFCVRLSILFLVGWFLDLKTAGKIVASHSACAASGQGDCAQGCCVPNISVLNAGKISLASQVVQTSAIARFG